MDGRGYIVFLSYFVRGIEPGYYAIIGLSMDGHGYIVFLSYFARGIETGYYAIIGLSMDGRGYIVFLSQGVLSLATMPSLDYPWMVVDTLYS